MDEINQSANFQQPQVSEPVEQPVQQPVKKEKNIFKYLFFVLLVLFLGIIITGYFLLTKKINTLSQSALTSTSTQTETVNEVTSTPTAATTVTPTESKESTLTKINDEWNLYTNYKYGFTLKVPKNISSLGCQSSELVPITFFENEDTLYFSAKYTNELINQNCQKTTATLNYLIDNDSPKSVYPQTKLTVRKFYLTKVDNDEEINQFIKSKFGSTCKLGGKTKSNKNNIFNISISAEPNSLDESNPNFAPNCYIGGTNSFYNSTNGSLVIFYLGQEELFRKPNNNEWYDLEMLDSLSFF